MFYGSFVFRFFGVLFLWILKNSTSFIRRKGYIPFKQISDPPIEDPVDLLSRGLILNIIGSLFLLLSVFALGKVITYFMYV